MTPNALDIVKTFYETVFQSGDTDAAGLMMAKDFFDHAPWPGRPWRKKTASTCFLDVTTRQFLIARIFIARHGCIA